MSTGGEVSVKFSSQGEADLLRALLQVVSKVGGVKDAVEGVNEATEKVSPSMRRFAESVKGISADPLRELNRENSRLDEAIKAKLLTEQEAAGRRAQAQERYREQLRRTREETANTDKVSIGPDGIPQVQKAPDVAPLDLYKQRINEYRAALKAGTIDQKTFAAASKAAAEDYADQMRKARLEQEKADESLKKFAKDLASTDSYPIDAHRKRMEKLNEAVRKGIIDQKEFEIAAKKSQDTMQVEIAQNLKELDKVNAKTKEAGKEGAFSFSQMATSAKLAWAAAGYMIIQELDKMQQKAREAGETLKEASRVTGTIAQVSTSPEEFQKLMTEAEKVLAMGAASNFADAQSFIVALQNAGAMDEVKNFAMLRKYGVMEQPERMIAAATGLQTSMGVDKTGSKIDLATMGFIAGGSAPDTAEQVLAGAGKAGVAAKQQGASVEELLAVTAILSKAFGGSDIGGDRAKEFFSKLAIAEPKLDRRGRVEKDSPLQESFRGKSLEEILASKELASMTPAQMQKAFGSEQFAQAYGTLLTAKDEVLALAKATRDGRANETLITQKIANVQSDPRAMAAILQKENNGQLELRRQTEGTQSLLADAVQRQAEAFSYNQAQQKGTGTNPLGFFGKQIGFVAALDLFSAGPKTTREQQAGASFAETAVTRTRQVVGDDVFLRMADGSQSTAETMKQLKVLQERQTRVLEETRQIMAEFNAKVRPTNPQAPQPRLAAPARQEQAANAN